MGALGEHSSAICRDRHDGRVVDELLLEQYPGFTEKEIRTHL